MVWRFWQRRRLAWGASTSWNADDFTPATPLS